MSIVAKTRALLLWAQRFSSEAEMESQKMSLALPAVDRHTARMKMDEQAGNEDRLAELWW